MGTTPDVGPAADGTDDQITGHVMTVTIVTVVVTVVAGHVMVVTMVTVVMVIIIIIHLCSVVTGDMYVGIFQTGKVAHMAPAVSSYTPA